MTATVAAGATGSMAAPGHAATSGVAGAEPLARNDRATIAVRVDDDRPGRVAAAHRLAATIGTADVAPVRAPTGGPRSDPYRLAHMLDRVAADAVVLVAPRRRGPRGLVAGPVVAGRPVAIVQADDVADLPTVSGTPDPKAPWVVAAMAKNVFLDATEHWADTLAAGGRHVVDLRADRARRTDLVAGLAAGPRVVLYAGHGRTRGWAGYQALRFHHLADEGPRRAVGLAMAFACDTLGRSRSRWPFGARLVDAGVVRSYLGPASSVRTADAEALADVVVDLLAGTRPATVGEFVARVERTVPASSPAGRAWRTFRLVGRPDTPIG